MKQLHETSGEFNIQDVFNLLIENGVYSEHSCEEGSSSSAMCYAIDIGVSTGLLSEDIANKAYEMVDDYINDYIDLTHLLRYNGLPNDFESRKNLYLNWISRPKPI